MFGFKKSDHYRMNGKQFEEMKEFYTKLGFSDAQVKKLCKSCFKADIRKDDSVPYKANWTFYRNSDFSGGAPGFFSGKNANAVGRGVARAFTAPVEEVEDGLAADECVPLMRASAMPMEPAMAGAAPVGMAMPFPEPVPSSEPFEPMNTAETHTARENELQSPLDNAQAIFSANVNTASWTYLRSKIARHQTIDTSFVRMEEIINSYRYDLPAPKNDELFSISAESGVCPWDKEKELLFLGFKGKKADKNCRQNLVLLVDVSGSMEDEWILTQMSMAAIISKLKAGDTLSIISYSDRTTTVVKQLECSNSDKCVDAILAVDGIGGCTYGSQGLSDAYEFLQETYDENANNRVFIFTDGDFNFGITSEGGLEEFILKKRETGIYLSIVGYGENNFKDNKMEALARNGNGNYTFVSNPADILDNLSDKLISNLITIAKDVKISVELNPAFVSEYRLLGYDVRKLTQQEFHDTEKAADGIGSEHNVAAVIELKRGKAQKQHKSRYVSVMAENGGDEIAFVEVHYKSPEGENLVMTRSVTLKELSESENKNIPAVSLMASFGLMVKDSKYKGSMTKTQLLNMTSELMNTLKIDEPEPFSHFDIIRQYAVSH